MTAIVHTAPTGDRVPYIHSRDGRQMPPPDAGNDPPRHETAPEHIPSTPLRRELGGQPFIGPLGFDDERKLAFLTIFDEGGPVVQFTLDPSTTMRLGADLVDIAETLGATRW